PECPISEVLFSLKMKQILFDLILSEFIRRLAEVPLQITHLPQIILLCPQGKTFQLHVCQHLLSQLFHAHNTISFDAISVVSCQRYDKGNCNEIQIQAYRAILGWKIV